MDLVVGAKRVIIAMDHVSKDGQPKIVKDCKLPLTAVHVVNTIVTEMAVIEVIPGQGLMLMEIAPGLTVEEVQQATGPSYGSPRTLRRLLSNTIKFNMLTLR